MVSSISLYHYSIKYRLFDYTQLNDQTVLFLTIQFSMVVTLSQRSSITGASQSDYLISYHIGIEKNMQTIAELSVRN